MPTLRYLTADTALTLDGDTVLEAAASTREAEHAAVRAEVARVLAWCHAQQPQGHGPRDEGGRWHHDLHTGTEPGGWHSVHLTITGDPGFIEALLQAFFPTDTD
ncbi:hypothetical protein IP87_13935 [beta proteobacterium AAP121]|nr:hypothetical protein IP80_10460 [beta proteobacterium AAP65]KPF96522.1 hypothetical protein IP87_13935 [beta proteobacterium AAP121]